MSAKVRTAKLADFAPDAENPNQGSPRGQEVIRTSIRKNGTGRSLLADKNGKLIAGNQTQKAALASGIEDVIVVEDDGTHLIVVQRTDLDLDSEEDTRARELSVLDNHSNAVGLTWDKERLAKLKERGILKTWSPEELQTVLSGQRQQVVDLARGSLSVSKLETPTVDEEFDVGNFEIDLPELEDGENVFHPDNLESEPEVTTSRGLTRDERQYGYDFKVGFDDSVMVTRAIKEWERCTELGPADWLVHMAERFLNEMEKFLDGVQAGQTKAN